MRKTRQDHPLRILSPIPDPLLPAAAALWWRGVGPGWPRLAPPSVRASHGILALEPDGGIAGVVGLRDSTGGFLVRMPLPARLAFRAAPPTSDLVIDGIVAARPGQGAGRALIAAACDRARATGHPGLRAELLAGNAAARAFYDRQGFHEVARGRFGWPWSGEVVLMRLALAGP